MSEETPFLETLLHIDRTHREIYTGLRELLDDNDLRDLTPSQAMILVEVARPGARISDLMARCAQMSSNMSYNVQRLKDRGYVEVTRAPNDGRGRIVTLTDAGERAIQTFRRALAGQLANPGAGRLTMNEAELDELHRSLRRFLRVLVQS